MAVDLMEMLKGAVSDQIMGKLGGVLGMEPKKTSSVFETAAGTILGGMMKKASNPQGAEAVFDIAKNQDTGILDKLGDLLGGGEQTQQLETAGGGILDSVLGGGKQTTSIIETLAKFLKLDGNMIGKLLKMVAPMLIAVIGRHIKNKALDAVGLGGLLGGQKSHLAKRMPAGLAGSLGLSDFMGDAGNAVSGAADSARQTSRAATEAASQGGGLLKMLLPLILLAVGVWALWHFVLNKAPDVAVPDVPTINNIDVLGETGTTLKTGFSDITTGFQKLTTDGTEAGANNLVTNINDFSGKIEGLGLGKLDGAKKTAVTALIGGFVSKINGFLEKLPEPLKAIVQPAVDGLLNKLKF